MKREKTVLVFGTFDGLHAGHRAFLHEAAGRGDRLVVAVARDSHVKTLKGHPPQRSESQRVRAVEALRDVDDVFLSDETLGSYQMVRRVQPHVIVLGFDQDTLAMDLHDWMEKADLSIPLIRLLKYDENAARA